MTLLAVPWVLAGCSDRGADPVGPSGGGVPGPVSFAGDVQPIFDTNCVGCHGAGGNGGLDLRAGGSRANLVGVVSPNYGIPRVRVGDAAGSLLYRKLSGDSGTGSVMPPGGGLPPATVEKVRRWIDEGALDN